MAKETTEMWEYEVKENTNDDDRERGMIRLCWRAEYGGNNYGNDIRTSLPVTDDRRSSVERALHENAQKTYRALMEEKTK